MQRDGLGVMPSLIETVLTHYYPDWKPPDDYGSEWISALCPFHGDSRPSGSVSYEHNAFMCFACGVKGNAVALVAREEEVTYREAIRIAENIYPGCVEELSPITTGQPSRRSFGEAGATHGKGKGFRPGVRRRTFTGP